MFRHIEGCKAQCGDMTLMVAHNFAEWHVIIIKNPTTLIRGQRQISEDNARAHARQLAEQYLREEKQDDASSLPGEFVWVPLETRDWLEWRP